MRPPCPARGPPKKMILFWFVKSELTNIWLILGYPFSLVFSASNYQFIGWFWSAPFWETPKIWIDLLKRPIQKYLLNIFFYTPLENHHLSFYVWWPKGKLQPSSSRKCRLTTGNNWAHRWRPQWPAESWGGMFFSSQEAVFLGDDINLKPKSTQGWKKKLQKTQIKM